MSNLNKVLEKAPETVYVDDRGVSYDTKGNPIRSERVENGDSLDKRIALVTRNGQSLRYADVYPGPTNVHIQKALTDFSVSYELDSGQFIAPIVSPIKTVDHVTDQYFQISRSDVTRNYGNELKLATNAPAVAISQGFEPLPYNAQLYGIRAFLGDRVVNNADEALELQYNMTKLLTSVIDLAWDRRIITNFLSAGSDVFSGTTFNAASGGYINTATDTNPYIQIAINYARAQIILNNNGLAPTHVVMSVPTALAIAQSVEIRKQVVFSNAGPTYVKVGGFEGANYGLPDTLYGLKVIVAPTPSNNAAVNAADSYSYLLDNTITVMRIDEPARRTHNSLTSFRFKGLIVKAYRQEDLEGQWVEVRQQQDEVATNLYGAYQLTATISS